LVVVVEALVVAAVQTDRVAYHLTSAARGVTVRMERVEEAELQRHQLHLELMEVVGVAEITKGRKLKALVPTEAVVKNGIVRMVPAAVVAALEILTRPLVDTVETPVIMVAVGVAVLVTELRLVQVGMERLVSSSLLITRGEKVLICLI
jgi:hypothetical protein